MCGELEVMPDKVKARRVRVVREVGMNGKPIEKERA